MKLIVWHHLDLKRFSAVLILGFLVTSIHLSAANNAEVFPTPDNLKDNVAFWKRVYTQLSLKEGVIHDRDFPLIIYKRLTIGKRSGRTRSRFVRKYTREMSYKLKRLANKKPHQYTPDEENIAAMFKKHASMAELKDAYRRVRFQQGQKERFKKGLERSGKYMSYIRSIFKIYKIPERICYLPHVESSFNYKAYSRVGAAGMWQFMRSTGRRYMKIDYRIDERRDPIKATIAAAKLLRYNYEQTKSWPLAITAYNHGLVSIKRAIRVTKSRDIGVIIDKYKNRRFKFASKNFYGCFLASSEIAANAEKYFDDINYQLPFAYNEVQLKSYLRPRTLAKQLSIPESRLADMNPALRSIVFRRQLPIPKGFKLRIPHTISQEEAAGKLASLPSSVNKKATGDQHYYTVRRGDTLYRISRIFGVSTEGLIIANEISRENRIYIGQVLRIPGKDSRGKKRIVKRNKKTPTAAAPPPPDSQPKPEPPVPTPETKTKNTDSQPQNPIPSVLPLPQWMIEDRSTQVEIPYKPPSSDGEVAQALNGKKFSDAFDATLYHLDVRIISAKRHALVQVAIGETLGHYADWLSTSVRHLRRLNPRTYRLRVDQTIKIPLKHQNTFGHFNAKRLEYHMAQEEDFYNLYSVVDTKSRKLAYGDTLWSICNRDEEIPLWLLKKFNRETDLENLKVGMELTIPVVSSRNGGRGN